MKHEEIKILSGAINKFAATIQSAVSELQSQFDEMTEQPQETKGRWRPKPGEYFAWVGHNGTICGTYFTEGNDIEYLFNSGNCFQTGAEAEQYKQRTLATQRVKDRIREIGGGEFVYGANNWYATLDSSGELESNYIKHNRTLPSELYHLSVYEFDALLKDPQFTSDYKLMLGVE